MVCVFRRCTLSVNRAAAGWTNEERRRSSSLFVAIISVGFYPELQLLHETSAELAEPATSETKSRATHDKTTPVHYLHHHHLRDTSATLNSAFVGLEAHEKLWLVRALIQCMPVGHLIVHPYFRKCGGKY